MTEPRSPRARARGYEERPARLSFEAGESSSLEEGVDGLEEPLESPERVLEGGR